MLTLSSASVRAGEPHSLWLRLWLWLWLSAALTWTALSVWLWLWLVELLDGLEDRALAVLPLRWDLRFRRNGMRLCLSSARLHCAIRMRYRASEVRARCKCKCEDGHMGIYI